MDGRGDVWGRTRNVLAVRLDTLGDVLMTTPAIRALKETEPQRSITLLTSPRGAEVAPFVQEVDQVIAYRAPWMPGREGEASAAPDLELAADLRSRAFDAAVIFTVYTQNPLPAALLCFLADIPLRLAHSRENPYSLLTDWVAEPEPQDLTRHEVRRQLDLVSSVGFHTERETLSFHVPEEARKRAGRILGEIGLNANDQWVVIHPGASASSRRYPPESFAEAAGRLVRDAGHRVVFTGSADEAALIEEIRGAMGAPSTSLAGELSLGELGAILERVPLLISNNTGPVHVAAALGTPVVDLYALTNPQHAPWGVPSRVLSHDVPCKYCYRSICPEGHHNCLRLVTPEQVVRATQDLLAETRGTAMALAPAH